MADRWLIYNFDGTWNGRTDISATNVLRFHNALSGDGRVSFYYAGPGDEDENGLLGRFLGGMFGFGCYSIRDAAIAAFDAIYCDGDRIAVTGFSRGAAIARMFASELAKQGYDIDFLGVWDTVFARLPFGRFQKQALFGDLHVSPRVKRAFHALALNEDREAFAPNLIKPRDGIEQVWFTGNHADIGGGYGQRGYADITLNWMVEKANECGLHVHAPLSEPSPCTQHREDWKGPRSPRDVPADAVMHGSVK